MCLREGVGLDMQEIDIHNGGSKHDLLDSKAQERIMAEIESGDVDLVILSPPCASWSRAPWSNNTGPGPVRSREHDPLLMSAGEE